MKGDVLALQEGRTCAWTTFSTFLPSPSGSQRPTRLLTISYSSILFHPPAHLLASSGLTDFSRKLICPANCAPFRVPNPSAYIVVREIQSI